MVNFFTIGHSTRSIEELVELLQASQVERVVDVRHMPRSRANPQFNRDTLANELRGFQIDYAHLPGLGGLRHRAPASAPSLNAFWENASFRNYADYAMSEEFREALAELRDLGQERPSAIMCAEAVWWRCHRRIIADYLIGAGAHVFHILGKDRVDRAELTSGAIRQPDGTILYPAVPTLFSQHH